MNKTNQERNLRRQMNGQCPQVSHARLLYSKGNYVSLNSIKFQSLVSQFRKIEAFFVSVKIMGYQASIIGGATYFVKELEQLLHSFEL